jgi:hypothetical protein
MPLPAVLNSVEQSGHAGVVAGVVRMHGHGRRVSTRWLTDVLEPAAHLAAVYRSTVRMSSANLYEL